MGHRLVPLLHFRLAPEIVTDALFAAVIYRACCGGAPGAFMGLFIWETQIGLGDRFGISVVCTDRSCVPNLQK
jgi:hypothetical protein